RTRIHLTHHHHVCTQKDLWTHGAGAVADLDRIHRLWSVGTPHVCYSDTADGPELLHCGEHDDSDTHWRTDFLLDCDTLGRQAEHQDAFAFRAWVFRDLYCRWIDGGDAGGSAA